MALGRPAPNLPVVPYRPSAKHTRRALPFSSSLRLVFYVSEACLYCTIRDRSVFVVHRIFKFGQIWSSSGRGDWRNHGLSRHVERMPPHVTTHHCDVICPPSSLASPTKHTGADTTKGKLLCRLMNWAQSILDWTSRRAAPPPFVSSRALP